MKRRIFAATIISYLILPFGVNAATTNLVNNNILESAPIMNQFAQNHAPHDKRMGRGGGMK